MITDNQRPMAANVHLYHELQMKERMAWPNLCLKPR